MPYQTWVSATALLIAAVPVATVAAADGATQSARPPAPSVYAVSIRLRSAARTLTVQGYADTARRTADLTTRLPGGHNAELRLVAGEAYVHIDPAAPWVSIDPTALGIPVRALWAAAAARHLTVKIGPGYATTLIVNVTPVADSFHRASGTRSPGMSVRRRRLIRLPDHAAQR
jgi:hypothetical protein